MPINGDILSECVPPRPAAEMLLIESLYDGDAPATDRLELSFDYRSKSRLRATLASGAEAGLFLPRGTLLRGGQKLKASDGRIDHVHNATLEFRRSMSDQLLKLNQMLERMKRRRVEELERDIKDLRVQSNHLKNEENEF